ncbi:MAG: branched-chain amino acid ABC transporter permease [Betaproteobacteria bacterium]|nr:branched-chain amino acid ABC transporter permease [Betaproteobacteria bacterium]
MLEWLPWLAALAVLFLFQGYLSLAASIAVMTLFVLSLDLALGFAGIVTLGHAVFFGTGAYAAALIALHGWQEPISGVLMAGGLSALLALVIGVLILHLQGLPLIMTTLALGLIAHQIANAAGSITGGDNGLQDIRLQPLFGTFPWSVFGQTSYLYALAWLFILFFIARRLVASPFGLALQGIRQNRGRMQLLGANVTLQLVTIYVFSGFMAGVAGALSAQTTKFVGLEVYSLDMSAAVLIMLVLGGAGRLYGAIVGTAVYMVLHHFAAIIDPYNWMFAIGVLLVAVVLVARGGLMGLLDRAAAFLPRRS